MTTSISLILSFFACKSCNENQVVEKEQITETAEEELPPFENDWGSWLSMGVLSTGAPVVSYYDKTDGALGLAIADLSTDPVIWENQEVDGYNNDQGLDVGDHGKFSALAITSTDDIWIAHHDVGLKTLRYAYRANGESAWTTGVADTGGGSSPDAGWFASIALNSSGHPVIPHYDNIKKNLRVAHWDGSSFSGSIVDEGEDATTESGESVEANVGMFTAIAIDGDTEYITYYDAAQGALKLAYGTSGNYTLEVIDTGNVGQWSSIAIENGQLHIAYHDQGNQNLKYATGTPGNFSFEILDDSDMVGADTDIFVNGTTISVVYFDGKNNNLKQASNNGGTWTTSTLAGEDGALGFHNELASYEGSLYGACYDYTNKTIWFSVVE